MKLIKRSFLALLSVAILLNACGDKSKLNLPDPDPNNAGLTLPEGFGAIVTVDNIGKGRHMAVSESGDLYVKLRAVRDGHGILAFRDNDGNGIMDEHKGFMPYGGTGIAINNGYLYCSSDSNVYRYKMTPGELAPSSEMELIATGFPKQGPHATKPMTFDGAGNMYVTVGAPVNAGEKDAFQKESPGIDPTPYTARQAGIWQFDANKPNQTQAEAYHYAVGIRNALALDWNFETNSLYAVNHGRDMLHKNWPEIYTLEQNADLPAEQFIKVNKDQDYGWPFCYYDHFQEKQILGAEFGGDGKMTGRCGDIEAPLVSLPAHTAPNDLLFYTGDLFPKRYKNGAFIALHGSWDRVPYPQMGYAVVFLPFENGKPTGDIEEFATGFAGVEVVKGPKDAQHRPTGLAQGPDGDLFVVDDVKGRVWRIYYYK
jgi:glucose/arabinose dehydrogenase